jgi:hypothetical protein
VDRSNIEGFRKRTRSGERRDLLGQVRCQRVSKGATLLTENIEGAADRVAAITWRAIGDRSDVNAFRKSATLLTENIEGAADRVAAIYPEISDLSPSSGRLGQVKYRRAQALAAFKAGRRIADRGPKEMGIVDCRNIGDRDCRNIGDRSDVNAFRKSATLLTGEQRRCRRQGCDRIHGDI